MTSSRETLEKIRSHHTIEEGRGLAVTSYQEARGLAIRVDGHHYRERPAVPAGDPRMAS